MSSFRRFLFLFVLAAPTPAVVKTSYFPKAAIPSAPPPVRILRVAEGGIQPQAVMGADGALHMIYFRGDASAGNIEYICREAGSKDFSAPVRVNGQPGSAVAIGTVRGPQMAVGRNGRVYVVWFGSAQAEPRGPEGLTPVLFSRLDDSRTAFEPQRSVMQFAKGVDGGLSVAADRSGNVFVVWHAIGSKPGEAHRRVYLARSTDDGKTFARERAISPAELGACGCCGMRAAVDWRGRLFVLYRAAAHDVDRDMTLLESRDHGETFQSTRIGPWHLNACPMSTASLYPSRRGIFAAWETAGQIFFEKADAQNSGFSCPTHPVGEPGDQKHPSVVSNYRGWVLLAWTEGTAWEKGGSLAWQLYDPSGRAAGEEGHARGVPVWDLPSAFAGPKGDFTIVY